MLHTRNMFAFFRVSVAGSAPQTIVFKLDNDKCPKTCDNFISICQSRAKAIRPTSSSSHDAVEPTYRGTEFHRIIPGFCAQGGDFSKFDGKGGFAAPTTNDGKATFPDECFDISHDREGILSMANRGKNTNGSQFFITLGKALHLDGKHVAFGKVVRNMACVKQIAQVETDANGKPVAMQRVIVTDCGLGTGDDDPDSHSSSSSSSCSASSKKKQRRRSRKYESSSSSRKKKRKRSRSSHRRQRDSDEDDDSSRKHRKKSKEKTSHRRRERDHETKKRQKKHDDRHRKKRRH